MRRTSWACVAAVALALCACGDDSVGTTASSTGAGGAAATGSATGASTGSLATTTAGGTTSSGSGASQPAAADLYGTAIHDVVLEIDYMPGAEPYTGDVLAFGDIWDVARTNVERLFQGSGKAFTIPSTLDQMQLLGDVTGADFTVEQILAIADAHRDQPSAEGTASFYLVWLDGHYRDATGVQQGVLGVSLGATGVIAMFKPVIASTGGTPGLSIERYTEQATLVHELGHAAGLVDNGIGMAAPHHDDAHAAHCANEDCIMYWAIESTAGAIAYVQKAMLSSDTVLWGAGCLDDAAQATAAAP